MTHVRLTGQLRCATPEQAALVREHLPRHAHLSRQEPGCVSFAVTPTADPLVWDVAETFLDEAAFQAHQQRVQSSPWGQLTAGIAREYEIHT